MSNIINNKSFDVAYVTLLVPAAFTVAVTCGLVNSATDGVRNALIKIRK